MAKRKEGLSLAGMTPTQKASRRRKWREWNRKDAQRLKETKRDPEVQKVMRLLFLMAFLTHGYVDVTGRRIRELEDCGLIHG